MMNKENRYPALSAIVVVIKVVAALVAVVGVILVILAMRNGDSTASIAIMIAVVVAFVIMWAAAESIAVIIDIEANTRASAISAMRVSLEPVKGPVLGSPMEPRQREEANRPKPSAAAPPEQRGSVGGTRSSVAYWECGVCGTMNEGGATSCRKCLENR